MTCKEVYVVAFSKQPGLVKIGKAKDANKRIAKLAQTHGEVTFAFHAHIGEDAGDVEKALHWKYRDERTFVAGDGGTEFFLEVVKEDAIDMLGNGEFAALPPLLANLRKETTRCDDFVVKVFDRKKLRGPGAMTGVMNELWQMTLHVEGAKSLGFSEEESLLKAVDKCLQFGFITPKRLKFVMEIASSYKTARKFSKLYETFKQTEGRLACKRPQYPRTGYHEYRRLEDV